MNSHRPWLRWAHKIINWENCGHWRRLTAKVTQKHFFTKQLNIIHWSTIHHGKYLPNGSLCVLDERSHDLLSQYKWFFWPSQKNLLLKFPYFHFISQKKKRIHEHAVEMQKDVLYFQQGPLVKLAQLFERFSNRGPSPWHPGFFPNLSWKVDVIGDI